MYAALMASIGMLLGTLARTEGQAVAIGVIAANVLGALGGCWWPIEVAAPWMQTLQLFLPTGWAMHALHALVSFGAPPLRVVPHVAVMLVTTIVLLSITTRRFRYV
jgi:ABC-type multidrug transport system permease subunit